MERHNKLVVIRGWAKEVGGIISKECVPFWGDKNILQLYSGDGCTALWIYQKSLNCAH